MQEVRQLFNQFQPKKYNLKLNLERSKRKFEGSVTIDGALIKDSNEVILHSKDLNIKNVQINQIDARITHGENDELTLHSNNVVSGNVVIEIEFEGKITDSLHGLYPGYYTSEGNEKEILTTQLESHHAREVFPCIDEPQAKAIFDLTLETEQDVEVIANTQIISQEKQDHKLVTRFADTPKMSTYLLAFVVGELEYLEAKTKDGVVVRTYATKGQAKHTKFPLEVAVSALEFYNDYFGLPYPLEKCDLIGIPDFSAGAMENWGCITFRESCFLVDEDNSDVSTKQFAAQVVIHELAHQWFGNLVTMKWWNDLWLNEGFARFMESFVADKLFPDWNLKTEFIAGNVAIAQRLDSLDTTHPIQVQINHPDEISTIFDAISYEKGAATIQMLHNYLGDDGFKKGLREYLSSNKLGNTITDDLWKSLSKASGKDVKSFMHKWIELPGFPVIKIEESNNNFLELTQQRFFSHPGTKDNGETWPIPLLANSDELPELVSTKTATVPAPTKMPFKLNYGQTGFYFTQYTSSQWQDLKKAIEERKLAVDDRLGLLNEIFELARAGYLPTLQAIDFLEAYKDEEDEHVWSVIASGLADIRGLVDQDFAAIDALNGYTRRLIARQLKLLGWEYDKEEALRIRSLRQTIIALATKAEEPSAVKEAMNRFYEMKSTEDLPADLRPFIYATVARQGGEKALDQLIKLYNETDFSEEKNNLAAGICATKNSSLTKKILKFMQNEVKSQDVVHFFLYLMRNRYTRDETWQWLRENWQWVIDNFGGDKSYDRFVKFSAGPWKTTAKLEEFKDFFMDKRSDPGLTRAIDQSIEGIEIRMAWHDRDFVAVKDYLVTSSIQSVTRS